MDYYENKHFFIAIKNKKKEVTKQLQEDREKVQNAIKKWWSDDKKITYPEIVGTLTAQSD